MELRRNYKGLKKYETLLEAICGVKDREMLEEKSWAYCNYFHFPVRPQVYLLFPPSISPYRAHNKTFIAEYGTTISGLGSNVGETKQRVSHTIGFKNSSRAYIETDRAILADWVFRLVECRSDC